MTNKQPFLYRCSFCAKIIDEDKEDPEMIDLSNGEYLHNKCALKFFMCYCESCEIWWGEDCWTEGRCDECAGELTKKTKKEVKEAWS